MTSTGSAGPTPLAPSRADRIGATLHAAFTPHFMDVVDDSAHHAGHAGAQVGGETHYNVKLISEAFAGQGRVARHRMVNDALRAEFQSGLHALSLSLQAPGEA